MGWQPTPACSVPEKVAPIYVRSNRSHPPLIIIIPDAGERGATRGIHW